MIGRGVPLFTRKRFSGSKSRFHPHHRSELACSFYRGGALQVNGVDLAVDQVVQAGPDPRRSLLGLGFDHDALVRDLDESNVVQPEAGVLERPLEAVQRHAARDAAAARVVLDVLLVVRGQRGAKALQVLGFGDPRARPYQDGLRLVDPGEPDEAGCAPCARAGMASSCRLPGSGW